MFQFKISPLLFATVLFFSACQNNPAAEEKAMNEYLAGADSVATSTSPDMADLTSDARKVIHKADIRCRVDNVQQAVKELEAFTVLANGLVQESRTQNDIVNEKSVVYKDDSVKTAQVYNTTAYMVIRVPVYALDTLSSKITAISAFTNHRNMVREDVTLQFLSNILKNRQTEENKQAAKKVAATKTEKPVDVVQYQDNNANQQVDRRIANLSILDDSRYATLRLELYQPGQVAVMVTQNIDKQVTTSFGEQLLQAIGKSVDMIKALLLWLIATWPLWLALAAILFWYKRTAKRRKALLIQS